MAQMEIALLGAPTVTRNGRILTHFESDKVRALLYYLVVESGKPVRREQLAGLLWPDRAEKRARASLSQALYNLRQVIEDQQAELSLLQITHTTLQINPQTDLTLDTAVFTKLLNANHNANSPAPLEKAVALYHGDFLSGFSLSDALSFEEWMLWQREHYHRQVLIARQKLAQIYEDQGKLELALAHTLQAINLLPWEEESHQTAMRLLAHLGRRNDAIHQYQVCHQILQTELGIDPLPQTQAIYEAIRSGEICRQPTPSSPTISRTQSTVENIQHNLPHPATKFIGRTKELADLHHFLATPDSRLITIIGAGGMGKTQLALACARQYMVTDNKNHTSFSDGVFLLNLAPLSDVEAIVPTLAEGMHFQLQGHDVRPPKQQILDYLQNKQLLLLFDNFEHLLTGANLLSEILKAAPKVQILATSRERLKLQTEQVYPIEGLDFPKTRKGAEQYTAVQLFCHFARRCNPFFSPHSEEEWQSLIRICRLVAGMPLALELAASWVDTLSLSDIAAEMKQSLVFLNATRQDAPDRHQSVRAVFQTSWEKLSEEEQSTFAQLSVFRGGFSREAAVDITNCSLLTLSRLVNKSLLKYDQILNRYQIHELMRQFAAAKLAKDLETETAVQHAHSHYYCIYLNEQKDDWHTNAQLDVLTVTTQEIDNIEYAAQFALHNQKWQWLVLAIDCYMHFYEWIGRFQDARTFCQAIDQQMQKLAKQNGLTSPETIRLWSKILTWLGIFTQNQEHALTLMEQGLLLLEHPTLNQQDTRAEKAFLLLEQNALLDTFEPSKAILYCQQSLALYKELEDEWGIAKNIENLALFAFYDGQFNEAIEKLKTALAIQEKIGDKRAQASSLNLLGNNYKILGQLDKAEQLQRKSLHLSQQLEDQYGIGIMKAILTDTLSWQGKFTEAESFARQGLAHAESIGHLYHQSYAHCVLGDVLLHQGQYQSAAKHADHGLEIVTQFGNQLSKPFAHMLRGQLAYLKADYLKAQTEFEQGITYFQSYRASQTGTIQAMLSFTQTSLHDFSQAQQNLVQVLAHSFTIKNYLTIVHILSGAALLFLKTGKAEQATQIWAAVTRDTYIATSQWFYDAIGYYIDEGTTKLSAKTAQSAKKEGQRLGVWGTAEILIEIFKN